MMLETLAHGGANVLVFIKFHFKFYFPKKLYELFISQAGPVG